MSSPPPGREANAGQGGRPRPGPVPPFQQPPSWRDGRMVYRGSVIAESEEEFTKRLKQIKQTGGGGGVGTGVGTGGLKRGQSMEGPHGDGYRIVQGNATGGGQFTMDRTGSISREHGSARFQQIVGPGGARRQVFMRPSGQVLGQDSSGLVRAIGAEGSSCLQPFMISPRCIQDQHQLPFHAGHPARPPEPGQPAPPLESVLNPQLLLSRMPPSFPSPTPINALAHRHPLELQPGPTLLPPGTKLPPVQDLQGIGQPQPPIQPLHLPGGSEKGHSNINAGGGSGVGNNEGLDSHLRIGVNVNVGGVGGSSPVQTGRSVAGVLRLSPRELTARLKSLGGGPGWLYSMHQVQNLQSTDMETQQQLIPVVNVSERVENSGGGGNEVQGLRELSTEPGGGQNRESFTALLNEDDQMTGQQEAGKQLEGQRGDANVPSSVSAQVPVCSQVCHTQEMSGNDNINQSYSQPGHIPTTLEPIQGMEDDDCNAAPHSVSVPLPTQPAGLFQSKYCRPVQVIRQRQAPPLRVSVDQRTTPLPATLQLWSPKGTSDLMGESLVIGETSGTDSRMENSGGGGGSQSRAAVVQGEDELKVISPELDANLNEGDDILRPFGLLGTEDLFHGHGAFDLGGSLRITQDFSAPNDMDKALQPEVNEEGDSKKGEGGTKFRGVCEPTTVGELTFNDRQDLDIQNKAQSQGVGLVEDYNPIPLSYDDASLQGLIDQEQAHRKDMHQDSEWEPLNRDDDRGDKMGMDLDFENIAEGNAEVAGEQGSDGSLECAGGDGTGHGDLSLISPRSLSSGPVEESKAQSADYSPSPQDSSQETLSEAETASDAAVPHGPSKRKDPDFKIGKNDTESLKEFFASAGLDVEEDETNFVPKAQPRLPKRMRLKGGDVLELAFCMLGTPTATVEELQAICMSLAARAESEMCHLYARSNGLNGWNGLKYAQKFSGQQVPKSDRAVHNCLSRDGRFFVCGVDGSDRTVWACRQLDRSRTHLNSDGDESMGYWMADPEDYTGDVDDVEDRLPAVLHTEYQLYRMAANDEASSRFRMKTEKRKNSKRQKTGANLKGKGNTRIRMVIPMQRGRRKPLILSGRRGRPKSKPISPIQRTPESASPTAHTTHTEILDSNWVQASHPPPVLHSKIDTGSHSANIQELVGCGLEGKGGDEVGRVENNVGQVGLVKELDGMGDLSVEGKRVGLGGKGGVVLGAGDLKGVVTNGVFWACFSEEERGMLVKLLPECDQRIWQTDKSFDPFDTVQMKQAIEHYGKQLEKGEVDRPDRFDGRHRELKNR